MLAPLSEVPPGDCRQPSPSAMGSGTVECGICQKTFCGSAVVSGPVVRDVNTLAYSRGRKLYCDHCDHIQHWHQECSAAGTFFPQLITRPAIYKSHQKIDAFLSAHPEAAGVLQG